MRKGTDLITLDMLEKLEACDEGKKFFVEHHPGGGEYQKVLDIACEYDHADFASWLLDKLGATVDVLTVDEIKTDKSVVFAGGIIAESSIEAGGQIQVGRSIEAGETIRAGKLIKAGKSIEAGLLIKAGGRILAGRSISAGWSIETGELIRAGEQIQAGWSIRAGWSISAGWSIETGKDFGIYAGLNVGLSNKAFRTVSAKIKPDNLMCGEFVPLEANHED